MSCPGSIPAVASPVTLRMLSAPAPREVRPKSCTASTTWIASFAATPRNCRLARVVTWAYPPPNFSASQATPVNCQMRQNAIGDAQPAHVTVLGRRDIEETVKPPTEIIGRLRIFVARGLAAQLVIRIEGMLFALPLFLIDEFLAGLDRFVLGPEMRRIGSHWRWLRRGLWRVAGC